MTFIKVSKFRFRVLLCADFKLLDFKLWNLNRSPNVLVCVSRYAVPNESSTLTARTPKKRKRRKMRKSDARGFPAGSVQAPHALSP